MYFSHFLFVFDISEHCDFSVSILKNKSLFLNFHIFLLLLFFVNNKSTMEKVCEFDVGFQEVGAI